MLQKHARKASDVASLTFTRQLIDHQKCFKSLPTHYTSFMCPTILKIIITFEMGIKSVQTLKPSIRFFVFFL